MEKKGLARDQMLAKTIMRKGCTARLGIGGQVQDEGDQQIKREGYWHCLAIHVNKRYFTSKRLYRFTPIPMPRITFE